MLKYLVIIFLVVFAKGLYANEAMFSSYSNTLYLSELKIFGETSVDDELFHNVYLILNPAGQYEIYHYEGFI